MLILPRFGALAALSIFLLAPSAFAKPPTLDPTFGLPLPRLRHASAPPASARWIWADATADNQIVFLRRTFALARVPRTATLFVSADNFFRLWVNGKLADESRPDPKDENVWQHVHQVNVARFLKPGQNVLAMRAENAGGAAGAVARLEIRTPLETDRRWKATTAAGIPENWASLEFDDAGWRPAREVALLEGEPWNSAGGLQGWPGYAAADAPYLAHVRLPVARVLDVHPGAGRIAGAESLAGNFGKSLTVTPAPDPTADPPSLVLDFGKEVAGRVLLDAQTAGIVLVGTGESYEEATKSPWGGQHRVALAPGKKSGSPYSAFRFARLVFPTSADSQTPIRVRVALDHKYYPVTYKGSFDCSDPLLTQIWYTGAYTTHLCMQEDIWDAPKRDRLRWIGDMHVSGEVINNVFADRFLMEQTLDRLRAEAQGGRKARELPAGHVNGIPGYSCAWVCTLADFHRHVGDQACVRKQHDGLISLLEYLRGDLDERGMFANKRGAWPFVDWAPDFNADGPLARAATHLFLIKAVREAVFLLNEMGDAGSADKYARWGDALTAAARQHLPDAATGTYSDRRQENAMAIYAGVATSEQTRAIYDTVLRPGSKAWEKVATPYGNNYVLFAMSQAGHNADALRIVRQHWGGMLSEGATSFWEGYDPSWEKRDFHAHLQADNGTGYFVSLCHGWSAGPTNWLTERVLGVRPTGGGFKTAEIVPDLGDLNWAEGGVPTPKGLLHVRAERDGTGLKVQVRLPAGVTALVGLPGQAVLRDRQTMEVESRDAARTFVRLSRPGTYSLTSR